MLIRDRPVLEHIIEQHAEEAAFLWTQRDAATNAPHYKRHHLARLDERVEAHVDGLRVAGEAGWRIALEQLERRCEKGELFAAGILALESGDMRRIAPLVALAAEAGLGVRRGFLGAIAWCPTTLLPAPVRIWDRSVESFERYLALCACSVHRADAGPRLGRHIEDSDTLVRSRAFRLLGELGKTEHLAACLGNAHEDAAEASYWASWSGVLLGDRDTAIHHLARTALSDCNDHADGIAVVFRGAGLMFGRHLIQALSGRPGSCRSAILALGHLGDPAAIPSLIEAMQHPGLARAAGQSFAMISGVDLSYHDLDRSAPSRAGDPVGEADAANETFIDDHDVSLLPWPKQEAVWLWWEQNRHKFSPGQRHLFGRPISESSCHEVLHEGFQPQRQAAAYELTLMRTSTPLINWRKRSSMSALRQSQ